MSEHIRTRTTEEETETERDERAGCPECDGDLVASGAETICQGCGLVVEENEIDRGPEWRAFDSAEKDEKSRVGAPTTNMMHDKGLSTNIDWRDRDAYGNSLDSRQRQKMQRLRKWNERFRTRDSKERNLKQALGEIDRMSSALGLPEDVRETASVIYRRALDENLLPGRSIEGVSTASLYAAARQAGVPRSLDEVSGVSRVEKSEIARTYRYVIRMIRHTRFLNVTGVQTCALPIWFEQRFEPLLRDGELVREFDLDAASRSEERRVGKEC